jgi:membrane fusion protein, multidrug efflux system
LQIKFISTFALKFQNLNMKKNVLFKLLFTGSFFILITSSCTNNNSLSKSIVDANIPVITLEQTSTITHFDYVSDIEANKNVEIRTRVKGYLEKILIDEGQEVQAGQIMFIINDGFYQTELKKAQAKLKIAEAEAKSKELELSNVVILVEKGVVTKTELQLAKAQLDGANAKVEDAKAEEMNASINLGHTLIKAPFDGVIDRIPFKIGSLIDEGSLLTTLSDTKFVLAYFNLSETEYLSFVREKQKNDQEKKVELILADGTIHEKMGKIETMEGQFESGTGSIAFRARFENHGQLLKHNATGKVRVKSDLKDVFIIPQKSVFEIQEKNFVFLVDKDNKATSKSFLPIMRYRDYYIVSGTFKKGDRIVYEGIQKVKDGSVINPKQVEFTPSIK